MTTTTRPLNDLEMGKRNAKLWSLHMKMVWDNPALLDEIPQDATVVFIPESDPELAAFNRELGALREREGRHVHYLPMP